MRRVPTAISATLVVLLAACSGAGSTAPASLPSTSASAAASIDPAPASASPAATPAATPAPTGATVAPVPAPTVFTSTIYGYRGVFPAGQLTNPPVSAETPWDGTSTINSDGPFVDRFPLSEGRYLFVYGNPTPLRLAAYAAEAQRLKAAWHGCPKTPETSAPASFSGVSALLTSFPCQGLRVFSLYAVRKGRALVINQFASEGDTAAQARELLLLTEGWVWPG